MTHTIDAGMTRVERLRELVANERRTHDLFERAARVSADAEERALYERLARREDEALKVLREEAERLEAEEFVQRALDC